MTAMASWTIPDRHKCTLRFKRVFTDADRMRVVRETAPYRKYTTGQVPDPEFAYHVRRAMFRIMFYGLYTADGSLISESAEYVLDNLRADYVDQVMAWLDEGIMNQDIFSDTWDEEPYEYHGTSRTIHDTRLDALEF
jgi:hypothetical protein